MIREMGDDFDAELECLFEVWLDVWLDAELEYLFDAK